MHEKPRLHANLYYCCIIIIPNILYSRRRVFVYCREDDIYFNHLGSDGNVFYFKIISCFCDKHQNIIYSTDYDSINIILS